jgi:hypothetical protein
MAKKGWNADILAAIAEIVKQNSTPEGRKKFRQDDGPAKATAMKQELESLAARLHKYE